MNIQGIEETISQTERGIAEIRELLGLGPSEVGPITPDELARLLSDAEGGDPNAQYALGFHHDQGTRLPKSNAEAVRWYRLAADQGHADAQCRLGLMYEEGRVEKKGGFMKRDPDANPGKWFGLAAAQGHAAAQYHLAWTYFDPILTSMKLKADFDSALQSKGESMGVELGAMYRGMRVFKNLRGKAQFKLKDSDVQEAYVWFSLAAAQGHSTAAEIVDMIEDKQKPAELSAVQDLAMARWRETSGV